MTDNTPDNWQEILDDAGETLRPDKDDGENAKQQVIARSYTINRARRRLNLHSATVASAVKRGLLTSFVDPDNHERIPAEEIEAVLEQPELYEQIAEMERIAIRDIAEALGVRTNIARQKIQKAGFDRNKPYWQNIREQWDLPDTLRAFRRLVNENRDERKKQRRQERQTQRDNKRQKREAERQRRAELRAQLVASFPAWAELDRSRQMMMLHIGPPNSGKTHDALLRLGEAGSGWYLAPLRLLAWEVFDRLNQRGVPCNLLTGEERIDVEGAEITAATIEMFNPQQHGDVVIIDEAQMLADPDRGWAWTRAMMQCLAPEMHVIAPQTAETLIIQMAKAANIPVGTVEHQRLSPIQVAKYPWSLQHLPERTILVAFSRKKVLELKTRLEGWGRSVSVVYGSLPPEVRRKQAERFAAGETEICVATDAVGMGLNLPADNVCFWEIEKYDGRSIRLLQPSEIQQIGGRAGRYGFSEGGEVGATRKGDLKIIRQLFYADAKELDYARVAPSVDDLTLIPGSLAQRLDEWSQLQSIPEDLRRLIKTAEMAERIELAQMLTNKQVAKLGLPGAVQLVNAPTRKSTRDFWYDCAKALIDEFPMPLPPCPPDEILDTEDLDYTEMCIACADIYLWLAHRREFNAYAEHMEAVQKDRRGWGDMIDEALINKIRMMYRDKWRN